MLAKSVASHFLAVIALSFACATSIAQEQRISLLVIPDGLANGSPAVLKIASSCRSKCSQRAKKCRSKCVSGTQMGVECKTNCRYAYGTSKKAC